MASLPRLSKEYAELLKEPLNVAGAAPEESNMTHWTGYVLGQEDSPYEGGKFMLDIVFSGDYPFLPPKIKFTTKIYHPNIDSRGNICLDILKNNWSPCLTISKVLLSIVSLLIDPNPNDPLEPEIAKIYINEREKFNQKAKEWTKNYAK